MSFNIILQTNNSDDNYITKSLTTISTVTGTLRENTSIIDPVFIVQSSVDSLVKCNYCTVSTFNRSYFVRDIVSLKNGLTEIHCHVDVLSSFADSIKSNKAIVKRQENEWNLYLDDGSFKVYNNPMILTKKFPSGFDSYSYILAVAGG